jgi:hypothetical protein
MKFFVTACLFSLALAAPLDLPFLTKRQGAAAPTTSVFNDFTQPKDGKACKSGIFIYSRGTGEGKNMVRRMGTAFTVSRLTVWYREL